MNETSGKRISISAADRAALKKLAEAGGGTGRRARIVLTLASGARPSDVVRETGAMFATIRAVRDRWLAGGAAALATRRPPKAVTTKLPSLPKRLCASVPEVIVAAARAERPHGRIPAVRMAIETWVRDAIAKGRVAPSGVLPSRLEFQRAFGTTTGVVQEAFASLAAKGFVRSRGGGRTIAALPPPFAGRYLFVGSRQTGDTSRNVGYMAAAEAAARGIERARGVRFDFIEGLGLLGTPSPKRVSLFADMRTHRWAGVFFRTWTDEMAAVGKVRLDSVPVCVPGSYAFGAKGITGTNVRRIASAPMDGMLDSLLADCAAAGRRRLAVLDHQPRKGGFQRAEVERAAASHGLELGPWHYQALRMTGESDGERDAIRAVLEAVLAPGRAWEPDCFVLMDDYWLGPLEEALLSRGAEAARRLFVCCLGNRPALPPSRLDVHFHGYDLEATLLSFVDWCDAIHAGEKDPPPPVMETF